MYAASSEAASQRILAGIKTALLTLIFRTFFLMPSVENVMPGIHIRRGGGFCGKFSRSSSMNAPSYCLCKASALELSEVCIYVVVRY